MRKIFLSCCLMLLTSIAGNCQEKKSFRIRLGAAINTNIYSVREIDDGKYSDAGQVYFSSTAACLNFIFDYGFFGVRLGGGFAHTKSGGELNYKTTTNGTYESSWSNSGVNPLFFVSQRINIPGKNAHCFFDFTFGREYYTNSESLYIVDSKPFIFKTGFGVVIPTFKFWTLEIKAGFGTRDDYVKDNDHKILVPDIEFGFYRTLFTHTSGS